MVIPMALPRLFHKRVLDVALIAATLPVYGTVLAACAALVRLVDGSPVFFRQVRVGRAQKRFAVLKLRTMTLEPNEKARKPTRLGRVLRHHGFDELPQFLNVLRGEMSLVGPRPLAEHDTERLLREEPLLARRFEVPPGITGLAQVNGVRGARSTAEADATYAAKASVALDLYILARTVWINVAGKR